MQIRAPTHSPWDLSENIFNGRKHGQIRLIFQEPQKGHDTEKDGLEQLYHKDPPAGKTNLRREIRIPGQLWFLVSWLRADGAGKESGVSER